MFLPYYFLNQKKQQKTWQIYNVLTLDNYLFIHFPSTVLGGGHSGGHSVSPDLSIPKPQFPASPGGSPDVPKPAMRYNHSGGFRVCSYSYTDQGASL